MVGGFSFGKTRQNMVNFYTIGLHQAALFSWAQTPKILSPNTIKRALSVVVNSKLILIGIVITGTIPAFSIPNLKPVTKPIFLSNNLIFEAKSKNGPDHTFGQINQVVEAGQFSLEVSLPTDPDLSVISQSFRRYHPAIDLAAPYGQPVRPILPGKVISAGWDPYGKGKTVIIEHEQNLKSAYSHLSKIEVNVGDDVGQDKKLGLIGLTGRTTGSHLHLEVYENDQPINPQNLVPIFEAKISLK
ncbi:MAG TPA: M23 family metallopeptidase [Patescibacteria group bacterium]